MTILINVAFRVAAFNAGETFIRGRHLLQYGYTKVPRLLEGSAYLRPGAYCKKYGICLSKKC